MENKNFTDNNLLQAFLSQTKIKVFWKDCDRRFLGVSQSFLDFYGLTEEELLGKTDEEMGWHINPEPYRNDEYQVIQTGIPIYDSEGKCIIRGQVRHIIATKLPIRNDAGEISGLIGYFRDVTDQKNTTDRLIAKANTDELTGLVNRSGLKETALEYVEEYEKRNIDFAIVVLDINGFKAMNDTYGHDFGDKYLKLVANELLKIAGSTGVVARMGGDYFVILRQLPRSNEPAAVSNTILTLLERIRLKQDEVKMIGEHSFRATIAVGWAAYSEFGDMDETLRNADLRMYEDKKSYQDI